MGHKCGYLALMAAIAGGAEAVIIPEEETDPEAVAIELCAAYDNGKAHAIVVVVRAIQQPAMEIWQGNEANVSAAQQALYHRACCNRAARRGEYNATMERT